MSLSDTKQRWVQECRFAWNSGMHYGCDPDTSCNVLVHRYSIESQCGVIKWYIGTLYSFIYFICVYTYTIRYFSCVYSQKKSTV